MKANVLLRESNKQVTVEIKDNSKLEISSYLKEKWQKIISLVAELLNVPAALIMQITDKNMEIFLKSNNPENPYPEHGKDTLLHGLYCETVIGRNQALHIDNSLQYEAWKKNPDVALNMISYYGLPIKWGDGSFFGTICALDNKTNTFSHKYRELMLFFKEIIEQDLILFEENKKLESQSNVDVLTQAYNRRRFNDEITVWLEKYIRFNQKFTLILLDINGFKYVNDVHGHVEGDNVLREFARTLIAKIRKTDFFFRYGGDEFAILTHIDTDDDIEIFMNALAIEINQNPKLKRQLLTFSYGYKIVDNKNLSLENIIMIADKDMYTNKRKKRL